MTGHLRSAGFTLIEMMVTAVIATILLCIAIPSYKSQMLKSRRTEARIALLDLAGREERLYSTTNTYSQMPADLGYGGAQFPVVVGNGYYTLNVTAQPAGATSGTSPATFAITATPTGTQVDDAQCATLTVYNTGKLAAADSGGADTSQVCWN